MAGQDKGTPGLGTLLQMGTGASPEIFTSIAEVFDIVGPALKADTVESTHLADTWKGFKITLKDGGTVKFTVNFLPTDATQGLSTGVLVAFENGTLKNWRIVWSDANATVWQFAAFVTDFQAKAPLTGMLRADISLKLDGIPAFI